MHINKSVLKSMCPSVYTGFPAVCAVVALLAGCNATPESGAEPNSSITEEAQGLASAHVFMGGYEAIGAMGEGYWGLYGKGTVGQGVVGKGGPGVAGGYFEAGTASTDKERVAALQVVGGDIALSATAPAHNAPVVNTITPTSMVKAWATILVDGNGTLSLLDGLNVASVSCDGNAFRIDFATPFGSPVYSGVVTSDRSFVMTFTAASSSHAYVRGYYLNNTATNGDMVHLCYVHSSGVYSVAVFGKQ